MFLFSLSKITYLAAVEGGEWIIHDCLPLVRNKANDFIRGRVEVLRRKYCIELYCKASNHVKKFLLIVLDYSDLATILALCPVLKDGCRKEILLPEKLVEKEEETLALKLDSTLKPKIINIC